MKFILLCCIFFSSISALGSTPKEVSYKSGDETVRGILYTPNSKGPHPAIIVIHEWWGLNDWVKEQASKLADEGYIALAIDLYRGKVAATANEAHEFMGGVPRERAARDLEAAFDYLQSQPNVKKDRIGAIGWCMGGGYSLQLALNQPKLAADVVNYGVADYASLAKDTSAIAKLNAPILGIYGGIPTDEVKAFAEQVDKAGKKMDVAIYPDAGHFLRIPITRKDIVRR